MKKIAAISLISIFLMSGCAVHNDETSIGKFGLAYKSNIQRKLDNQYYTEAEASLARGRISGAENIVKNDAAHFCVTQGKKMQDRKSTRLNSSHSDRSRMPSSA